jgi:hypothetical protein
MEPAMHSSKLRPISAGRSRRRLTGNERQILKIIAESSRPVTLLQLRLGTRVPPSKILAALGALIEDGFISHLNTVIDSWVCRAPLCVLPGGSTGHSQPPLAA